MTDIPRDKVGTILSCIAGSANKAEIRRCITEEHMIEESNLRSILTDSKGEVTILESLYYAKPHFEFRSLNTLKILRKMNFFHKSDIAEKGLLSLPYIYAPEDHEHYYGLAQWLYL